jgi:hypothetical protein
MLFLLPLIGPSCASGLASAVELIFDAAACFTGVGDESGRAVVDCVEIGGDGFRGDEHPKSERRDRAIRNLFT